MKKKMIGCVGRAPFGWKCTRMYHPAETPCAAVPRWWNLPARMRGF